jgi:hypothetical protein
MTPLDSTNFDEPLIRPLPGDGAPGPHDSALVPLSANDAYTQALAALARELAVSRTTGEVKEIRNCADAIRTYAKRAKDRGLEADAYEIRTRAVRRLGEMIIEQKATVGLNRGTAGTLAGRDASGGSVLEPPEDTRPTLAEAGIDKKLSMTAQRLAKLSDAEFECLVAEDRDQIIAFGREHAPLNNLKGGVDWYTPKPWIERVCAAMGGIDLDPASCESAQCVIQATQVFTKEQDGLAQPWHGNVFLNPPYTRGVIDQFVTKLIAERANYRQAIVLVDNRSDTDWFHRLCGIATAVAFPKGHIGFYSDNPHARAPGVWGSVFLYIGDHRDRFAEVFSDGCLVLGNLRDGA